MKVSEFPWQLALIVIAALSVPILVLGFLGYETILFDKKISIKKSQANISTENIDLHNQAQAMCVGIAPKPTNDILITAVTRPRINGAGNPVAGTENKGIVDCNTICASVPNREGEIGKQSCFGGVHLYWPKSDELKNKPGAAFPFQAVLYNSSRCNVDWSGPNYCCCGNK